MFVVSKDFLTLQILCIFHPIKNGFYYLLAMISISELSLSIQSGNRRALAKGITLIESLREVDTDKAQELLVLLQSDKQSIRLGISGVPGVGKSTFIEALGNHLINLGKKVAVLAVDPSSPTTHGSILGDKTRMETLSTREEAFIRPSPTAGTLGGVARRTRESITLCEAAGYDVILIETVGVGQSEYEVASMVDCFLVLMLPGAGDSLQGIKRGILEITDLLVINKADGDLKALADIAKSEYRSAFHFIKPKLEGINTEILTCSALENDGISKVWDSVVNFIEALKERKYFEHNRLKQQLNWFKRLAEEQFISQLWQKSEVREIEEQVKRHELTPIQAAKRIHQLFNSVK